MIKEFDEPLAFLSAMGQKGFGSEIVESLMLSLLVTLVNRDNFPQTWIGLEIFIFDEKTATPLYWYAKNTVKPY